MTWLMPQVIVHRHLLRAPRRRLNREPVPPPPWDAAVQAQLRLQTALWNRLVEIEQASRERVRALSAADEATLAAERHVTELAERQRELVAERKRLRRAARARIKTPEIDAALAEIKPALAEARRIRGDAARTVRAGKRGSDALLAARAELQAAMRERAEMLARRGGIDPPSAAELAAARERVAEIKRRLDALYEAEPDALPAIERQRQREVIAARQEFAGRGLYWGNYNAVLASYDTARKRAIKTGATLKFHGFRGEGRLVNQIQGGMSPAEFLAGSKGQAAAIAAPRAGGVTHRLRIRVDGETRAGYLMRMTRQFPPDERIDGVEVKTRIKEITVTRQKIAAKTRQAVVLTATRNAPPPEPPQGKPAVAIDLGWRRLADGIRVATAVTDDVRVEFAICPEDVIERLAAADGIRMRRDELRNAIIDRLCAIDWSAAPPRLAEAAARLRRRPAASFGRIARVALVWRDHAAWRPDDLAAAEAWRHADARQWEIEAHTRDAAIARRTDAYRKEAAAIADMAGVLIIEDFDIAAAARIETAAGDETTQVAAMRHYRTVAAPGEFRRWLLIQAAKRGVPVVVHEGRSNAPHADCGTTHAVRDETALRQYCPACGAYYDVDVNACRVMLAAYRARGPETPGAASPLAAE